MIEHIIYSLASQYKYIYKHKTSITDWLREPLLATEEITYFGKNIFIVSEQKIDKKKLRTNALYNIHNYIQNTKIKNKQHTS